MKIPTTEECTKLLDEFKVPENIRRHCFAVHKVSMILAEKLKKAGVEINIALLNAASLLHDIDKVETSKDPYKHGLLGKKWLLEKGYTEVGEIVEKHLVHYLMENEDLNWYRKILTYSDLRCINDNIVSLKERSDYLKENYPGYLKKEMEEKAFELEKEIFNKLDIKPEDLR